MHSWRGGGKYTVLAVELEKKNVIFFADPEIVQKVLAGREPYLYEIILKFNLKGSDNTIFIDAGVKFGNGFRVNFHGDKNSIHIGSEGNLLGGVIDFHGSLNNAYLESEYTIMPNSHIQIKGDCNTLEIKTKCIIHPGHKILFSKDSNYLYAGSGCRFTPNSKVSFLSSNGVIFLCGNLNLPESQLWAGYGSILFIGEGTTSSVYVLIGDSATKNMLIGADVMMSRYMYIRNNDGHIIYDKKSGQRINHPKSTIIGDHVWIGQSTTVLKGTHIEDGSIIGSKSLVNKHIPKRSIAVGVPAKVVKNDIIWDRTGEGILSKDELAEYDSYKKPEYNYKPIGYEKLLKIDAIDLEISTKEKVELINKIINN